jgi:hypothetical protein
MVGHLPKANPACAEGVKAVEPQSSTRESISNFILNTRAARR